MTERERARWMARVDRVYIACSVVVVLGGLGVILLALVSVG